MAKEKKVKEMKIVKEGPMTEKVDQPMTPEEENLKLRAQLEKMSGELRFMNDMAEVLMGKINFITEGITMANKDIQNRFARKG